MLHSETDKHAWRLRGRHSETESDRGSHSETDMHAYGTCESQLGALYGGWHTDRLVAGKDGSVNLQPAAPSVRAQHADLWTENALEFIFVASCESSKRSQRFSAGSRHSAGCRERSGEKVVKW